MASDRPRSLFPWMQTHEREDSRVREWTSSGFVYLRLPFAAELEATKKDFEPGALWDDERQRVRDAWLAARDRGAKSSRAWQSALGMDAHLNALRDRLSREQ